MSLAFKDEKKKKSNWVAMWWAASKSTYGTVSHRQSRTNQNQHINKVYVFHM